jgi:L-Ala-D/L-Glu epimerase
VKADPVTSAIARIEAFPVDIRLRVPLATSLHRYDLGRFTIARAIAGDGTVGWGEARESLHITGESQESILAAVNRVLAPALQGRDPFDLEGLHRRMDEVAFANTCAKCAIDMAVHDLAARLAGLPLVGLLGGAAKGPVPSSKAVSVAAAETMAAEAQNFVQAGFRTLKLKTGVDAAAEVEAVRRVREAVAPEIAIKLDANQSWTLTQATSFLEKVERYDVLMVEQPLPAWDFGAAAELRRRTSIPVMLDEGVKSPQDALRAIDAGACDYVNIKLVKTGGLYPAARLEAICAAAGIACQIGTLDTAIGSAAAWHLLHARPNIRFAEINGPTRLEWDVGTGFRVEAGSAVVDDGPGLGVEVDAARVVPALA